ncbi:MAG: hypothetical protein H6Q00_772 [Holophagaceae bacterium]|nr:hypothetical protein [Holophagaceae bacterium]
MSCACSTHTNRFAYACSGAANTGLLADQAVRRLALQGGVRVTCLAAVGAELEGFLKNAREAQLNLVVDGCPTACGHKTFQRLGLPHTSLVLTDFGVEKGKTLVDEALIASTVERLALSLPAQP